jgi:hypothetical protein
MLNSIMEEENLTMTAEQKKSKNPFINLVQEAAAAKNIPANTGNKLDVAAVKAPKFKNQVQTNKPTKRSAGRGR